GSDVCSSDLDRDPSRRLLPSDRVLLFFLALLALNWFITQQLVPGPEDPVPVSWSAFRAELSRDNVQAVHTRGEKIEGRFRSPIEWAPPEREAPRRSAETRQVTVFETIVPAFVDPGLETELMDRGVDISATPIQQRTSPLLMLLWSFGPALLIIGLWIWIFRRAAKQAGGMGGAGGMMGIGKSRAKRFDRESGTKVTFEDVAGIDEAEEELAEIVDF